MCETLGRWPSRIRRSDGEDGARARVHASVLVDDFLHRVALLVAFLALVSYVEWRLRPEQARRWRYALFILGSALLGTAFGVGHDLVTVNMSRTYFAVMKGLGWADLERSALTLGAKAGFSAGAILGALLAMVRSRKASGQEVAPPRHLCWSWAVIGGAALGAALLIGVHAAVFGGPRALPSVPGFTDDEIRRAFVVWRIHSATYVGALVGALLWIRVDGRTSAAPAEQEGRDTAPGERSGWPVVARSGVGE